MKASSNSDLPLEIKAEIEDFLRAHPNSALFESGTEMIGLAAAEWRASLEYGKLLFEAWNGSRSLVRRVKEIAYRDNGRLGLFVWKPGGRETVVMELREPGPAAPVAREEARAALRRELAAYLKKHFPEWRLERVSNRSDREHTFSAWYTRGLARRGRRAWAFIGLSATESSAAVDAALAYALNWLSWLRENSGNCVISGLKLFLPANAIPLAALRAAHLNPQALGIELFTWPCAGAPEPLRPGDFANAETHLAHRREPGPWVQRHRDFLSGAFGESLARLDLVADAAANALSFRVLGLEIARMEGQIAPRLVWGVEGERRAYQKDHQPELQNLARLVLAKRQAGSSDTEHEFYRLQPERWLESLLVADLSKLDPALRTDCIYPQVPAFVGADRGVVDILGISKNGRLAVIELKLHEEITLPLQGLDYWLRVKWLHDRGQFQQYGYFPGVEISPAPPLLYLVSPAFRFHPANASIIRFFHPSVEVIEVGLNQHWRQGVKALFRRPG